MTFTIWKRDSGMSAKDLIESKGFSFEGVSPDRYGRYRNLKNKKLYYAYKIDYYEGILVMKPCKTSS